MPAAPDPDPVKCQVCAREFPAGDVTLVDIELGGFLTLHLPICGDCTRLGMHIGAVASARLNKPD